MNPDEKYLKKIENINFQPIFILGFHRSGTTILYKMLNATKCFNYLSAYHVIYYDCLLDNFINDKETVKKNEINKFLKDKGEIKRGIDLHDISADFPEEYRFIFSNKSYNFKIDNQNLSLFNQICKKIQFISDNNKPLLLKNPYDYPNFLFIKKVLPNSKFIFIHRDPVNVLNSNMSSLLTLFEKKNYYTTLIDKSYEKMLSTPISFFIYKLLFSLTRLPRSVLEVGSLKNELDFFKKNINSLNQEDYINIEYENMCRQSNETIKGILKFLNLKSENDIDFSNFIQQRKTDLLKEIDIIRPYITKKLSK